MGLDSLGMESETELLTEAFKVKLFKLLVPGRCQEPCWRCHF